MDYICNLATQFRHFSMLHRGFRSLSLNDQLKLIYKNTPLFIHLTLSRYFLAETGFNQLELLFSGASWMFEGDDLDCISRVSFLGFCNALNLKGRLADESKFTYCRLLSKIRMPAYLSDECLGLMCNAFLFRSNNLKGLQNSKALDDLTQDSLELWEKSKHSKIIDIQTLGDQLEHMSSAFSIMWDWSKKRPEENSTGDPLVRATGTLSKGATFTCFTTEEGLKFQQILTQVWTNIEDVPIGSQLVAEFMKFSCGEPVSRTFMTVSFAAFGERFRKCLQGFDFFDSLTDEQQAYICSKNAINGVALLFAKLEASKDGKEQLKYACGKEQSEAALITQSGIKIKKLSMEIVTKGVPNLTNETNEYVALCNRIAKTANTKSIFEMYIILCILKEYENLLLPDEIVTKVNFVKLLLTRKLRSFDEFSDFKHTSVADSIANNMVTNVHRLTYLIGEISSKMVAYSMSQMG